MAKKEYWAIFDADNTLWDVEYLYDKAEREALAVSSDEKGTMSVARRRKR